MVGLAIAGQAARPRRLVRAALLLSTALTGAAVLTTYAVAQDATWKTNPNTSWFGDSSNWSTNTVPTGVASFGQSTIGSIINDNDRSVGTIQFNADARAYNFSFYGGSTFTFTGGGIVNNGSQAQIIEVQNVNLLFQNSASAGNNLITYRLNSSLGKIEFSGTSTAGSANFTSIFSGQLVFKDTASGGTAALTGDSSTVLDISGLTSGGTTIGSIAGGGSVVLGFNQLAVGGNNSSTTYGGVISGSGRLVKEGTGTLTLTGANSYLGHTTVNAGTLRLGASGVLVFNRVVNVSSGATLDLNNFNTTLGQVTGAGSVTLGSGTLTVLVTGGTFSGVMSGTGGLVVSGGGGVTYELTGTNTYSGGTTVGSGTTLSIASDAALGNVNGGVTLNGGTLSLSSSFNLASTRVISIGANGGTISTNGFDSTFAGIIGGSAWLNKTGAGTLTLTGVNTFAGSLGIEGGAVAVTADNQLAGAGQGVGLRTGGQLKANASFTSDRTLGLTGGGGSVNVTNAGDTLTWTGFVYSDGALTKTGAGTLVLTSSGNSYSGGTVIAGGTLQISADNNLGTGSLTLQGGTLLVTSDMSTGRATILEGGSISVDNGKTLTHSGVISGGALSPLIKSGAGALVLTGANTYTGGTTVNAGTLIGTTSTLKGDIANNGTVQFNQGLSSTYYGVMSGSGRLIVTGNIGGQYLVLAGANTYSGGTTVSGPSAALMVSSDGALGSATGGITLDTLGTLRFGASFNLASTRAITIGSGGGRINTNGFDTTISQSIAGPGFFTKEGAGTLTLTAANSYSSLSISGGVVVVSANNQLAGGTGAVSIGNGSTLRTASSFGVNRFLGLNSGGGTVDVTDAAATLTWGSEVYGTGTLTKAGAGKLSLTATNSFTGATAITGGTLAISGNAALGNVNNGVTFDGGTLQFLAGFDLASTRAITLNAGGGTIDTNGFNTTITQAIGGNGGLTKAGAGTLTLTGANTYLGSTRVNAGALVGSTDNLRGDIVNDGTVTFDQGFTSEIYAGAMSGSGSLVKSGLGVLILTGTNSYAGGTTLNDGTLRVSADANLGGATGTLTLAGGRMEFLSSFDFAATRNIVSSGGGGILYLNGNTVTVAGSVSGPTGLSVRDGKLILTGTNTIQSLDVRGATLAVASVDSLGLGTRDLRLAQGGTLQLLSGFTTANSLALLGSDGNIDTNGFDATLTGQAFGGGRLVKMGTGALTLTGSNSYTGGTLVSGGTLAVSSDGNLGTGGLTLNGGTLKTLGNLNSSLAVTLGAGGGTVDTNVFTSAFSGPVDGAGRLSVAGTGKLSLTAANAYSGGTTISGGSTLAIASDAALGDVNGGVTFDNGTLQWLGTFNLASTRAITLNAGGGTFDTNGFDTTISQSISGGGRLTKSGTGTLALSAGNTYIGGTTINGGTISISANTALGNAAGGITLNGGTLRTTSDISMNRAIVLSANSTIENNAILRLEGVVSGSGDLTKWGSGVLALLANNTFTGRLIVNQSVVVLDSGVPLGNIVVASGASVNFQDWGVDNTYAGVISGDGRVAQTGNGTLTLSGNNTYSGGTTVGGTSSSAVLAVSSDANLGDASGNIYFSGGKLRFLSSFDLASTRTVNINNFGGIFSLNGATTTFGGVIENAGALTIEGPGTMTFTGANTYSGGTTVSGGATLAIGSDGVLGTGGLVLGGGTLRYLASFDLANTRALSLNAGGGTFDTNGFNTTISQVIGGAGGLTKAGAGTLTLTGNNTYQGDTTINGGVLAISAGSNLGAGTSLAINGSTLRVSDVAAINRQTTLTGAATFDIVDGHGGLSLNGHVGGSGSLIKTGAGALTLRDTANYTGGTTVSGGNLTGSTASLQGNIVNNALVYFEQATDGTYAGVMSGTGVLSKFGGATLTLTGLNTYSGGTEVTSGTLAVGQDANLGGATADISLRFGGTLRFLSSFNLSAGRDIELGVGGGFQLVNSTNEIAGIIHGTGLSGLWIEGPGTLTLSGANTFTSPTWVTGSTLAVAADANLGNVNNSLTLDGATLQFLSSFNLAGTRAITLAGGSKFDTNSFNTTISQTIAGTGGLTKIGSGTLSLTGANTYSGSTIISGGTLAIGSDGALGNVNNGVTFDSGTLQLLGTFNVASTRAISLNAGGGTIDTNGFNTSIFQVIGGQGGLTKTGAGTLTLTGTNTYAGTTTVSGGVLAVSGDANLGSAPSLVLDGGTLRGPAAQRTFAMTISLGAGGGTIHTRATTLLTGAISGNGGLTKIGSSPLHLLGANTYLGGTTVDEGAIYIETDGALGNASGGVTLNNGGRITVGGTFASNRSLTLGSGGGAFDTGSHTLTWNGVIQGTAGLTKQGTGTLILSGTNTYTGNTVVNNGTLQISSDDNLGIGGSLILNGAKLSTGAAFTLTHNVESNAATIDTSGNDVTISGVVSGTSLSKQGLGTLTLTGVNSHGATSIQAGTLAIGSAASIGSGQIDIGDGALRVTAGSFALGQVVNLTGAVGRVETDGGARLTLSDVGGSRLEKAGFGTLVLSGNQSYTGGTSIVAGTLAIDRDGALGAAGGGLSIDGGTLQFLASFDLGATRAITLGAGGGTIDTNGNVTTIAQVIDGVGGLAKSGVGGLTLSGANTYRGGTMVTGGALYVSSDANLGDTSGALTIGAGAALVAGASFTIARNVVANGGSIADEGHTLTVSGNISGMELVKEGAGTLILTGTNTHLRTKILGGTLVLGSAANAGFDPITIESGTLRASNSFSLSQAVFLVTGDISVDAGANLTLADVRGGYLNKRGAGTLTLTGANSYSPTALYEGTLAISSDDNLGTGAGTLYFAGGTLKTLAGLTVNRSVSMIANGTVDTNGLSSTFNGVVDGGGRLTVTGGGSLTLAGANTFTGGTLIAGGSTVAIGSDAALGAPTSNVVFDNGTLKFLAGVDLVAARPIVLEAGGGTLDLTGTSTINGPIDGSGALTVTGAGTLTLSNVNTYSGGTILKGGVLRASMDSNLGAASGALVFDGGTLQLAGNFDLAAARAITLNAGGGTIDTNGFDTTAFQAINGIGGLTKAGAGLLTLMAPNTYSGGTTVTGGVLQLGLGGSLLATGALTVNGGIFDLNGNNQTVGSLSGTGGTLYLNSDGELTVNQATATSFAGSIEGSGKLIKTGSGTLTLSGSNTHTGGTAISDGTLSVSSDAALGAASSILAIQGGFLQASATFSTARTTTLLNGGGFDVSNGATLTHSGEISGSGYLVKTGLGTLVLSGTNTYTAETVIGMGTLKVTNNAALGAASATLRIQGGTLLTDTDLVLTHDTQSNGNGNTIRVDAGTTTLQGAFSGWGTLTKSGAGTLKLVGTSSYSGTTTVLAGTLQGDTSTLRGSINNQAQVVFDQDTDGSFTGVISNTGAVTKRGSGVVTFDANQSYEGGTTIAGGTLRLGTGISLSSLGSLTVNAGTFDLNGNNQTVGALAGTGGTIALGSGTLTADQSTNTSFAGEITGSGAFVKAGTGMLTLTGANTYSGGTTVNGGILRGTTESLQGNIVTNAAVYFFQATTGTYAGAMSGSGSMLVTGGGTVILTGNSTYSGNTTVGAGNILQLGAGGTTGSIVGDVWTNGTLAFNRSDDIVFAGNIDGIGGISLMGPGAVTLTGTNAYTGGTTVTSGSLIGTTASLQGAIVNNATVVFDQASDGVYAGVMDGTGKLVKTGSGNVTLSGANSYSNGTAVEGGTLTGSTASLQGAIATSSGTFVEFAQHADGTYAGVLSGVGSLIKSGSGNLTLTGANTYSGGTTVSAGTLTGTTTSLQGDITNNASVVFNQNTTGTYAGAMSGSGSLTVSGGGTVILTGNNSYANGTTIAAGTILQLGNGGITGWLFGNVVTDGTLAFNRSGDIIFAGDISGSGGVSLMGPGSVTLIGNNTFTGAITVGGTIRAGSDAELGPIGNVLQLAGGTVQATATFTSTRPFELTSGTGTFDTNGNDLTLTGVVSGAGTLVKTGAGSLILSGANTYSGGTTVSAGTLVGTTTSLRGDILNNAFVDFDQIVDGTYAGAMSGSGRLTKSGSGNLTLTGANSYSGGTVVLDGALTGTTTSLQGAIASSGAVFFDQATAGTYAGVLSGSGNLIVAQGDVTLAGANTYSGTTTVLSGATLRLGSGGSLGATRLLDVNATGTFDLGGRTQTVGGLTGAGAVTLGAGALTVDQATTLTFSGSIDGSGSLTKAGSGTLTLVGTQFSYTGGTTINGGLLRLSTSSALSSAGALTVNGGTFDLNGNNQTVTALSGTGGAITLGSGSLTINQTTGSTSYAGSIDGAGRLIKDGSGWLTLTGTNNYTGGTTVSLGRLTGTTNSLQGAITNDSEVVFDQTFDGTYGGIMSGTGTLRKQGSGTVSLSGDSIYAGGTYVEAGTLRLASSGSLSSVGALYVYGGTFDLNGVNQTVSLLSGDAGSAITLGAGTLTVDQVGTTTYGGEISGAGSLVKSGAGQLTLSGANTYGGGTTISDGTLQLGVANALAMAGAVTLTGGTFDLNGYDQTIGALAGTGGIVALNGGSKLTVNQGSSTSFAGVISGGGSLVKEGAGTLTLSGANTYTGGTVVSAGVLQMGAANAMPLYQSLAVNGGTFDLNGYSQMVGTLSGSGGTVDLGAATLTAIQRQDAVYGGVITGTGALILQNGGANLITLTGQNTYSGGTIVTGLWLQGTTDSLQGDIVVNSALVTFEQGFDGTYAGMLSGNGALVKKGSGTVTLTGANTYGDSTNVYGGILRLGTGGSLSASASLYIVGGTFDLNGANQTVRQLDGQYGDVTLGSGTLTVNQATNTLTGLTISGSGHLVKTGAGQLTLTGSSTYTGGTTVSGGTLAGTTFSLQGAITNNAAVVFDQGYDGTYAGVMSGSGSLTKTGTANLTLTGASTYSGGTVVNGGTLQLGAGGSLLSTGALAINDGIFDVNGRSQTVGALTGTGGIILDGGALTVDYGSDTTFAGIISGSGSFIKAGSGTLTLTGANTNANTVVSGGILQGTTSSLQGSIVNNAAVVFNQAADGTYSGVMSGSGVVTKAGNGTLILTANNTYSGVTTISGGILQLGNGGTAGMIAGNVDIASGGVLAFNRSDDITFDGDISGDGAVGYMGPGVVTLTGTNTYTGGTAIIGGTVQAGSDDAFGTAGARLTLVGGTIQATANFAIARPITLTVPGGTFDTNGYQLTLQGAISGTGALTKTGAGTLILDGTNDYSGGTTVSAGVLQGTTVSLQGDIENNAAVVFDQAGAGIYAGSMSGSGSLTKNGTGTVTLIGANTYTGDTIINIGTLALSDAGSISSSSLVTIAGGATFNISGSVSAPAAIQNLAGSGTVQFIGRGLEVQNASGEFAGVMAGNGPLLVSGGTMTLSGVSTYFGGTEIARGATLALKGTGSIANSLQVVFGSTGGGASAFDISQTATGASVRGIVDSLGGGVVNLGAKTLTLTNGTGTFAGVLQDGGLGGGTGGGLMLAANVQQTLAGTNTYTGATTVSGNATLWLSGTGSIATSSGLNLAAVGAVLDTSNSDINQTIQDLEGVAGSVVRMGTGLAVGTSNSTTFGGVIVGSSSFTKQGSGTLTLTGANTYTGGTVVNAGALQLGAGGSLASGSALTVNGGTFDLNGQNQTVGALSGIGGTVGLNGGAALTLNQNTDTNYAGAFTGNGSLVKDGSGTLALTGASSHTGGTMINNGTLQLGAGGSLASTGAVAVNGGTFDLNGQSQTVGSLSGTGGTLALSNNGALTVNQSTNTSYAGAITGSGSLTKSGSGTLTLTGTNTYTGGTTVSGGTLAGTTSSLQGNIVNNANVTFDQVGAGVYAGAMSGTGTLTKSGAGTVVLTGENVFSGGTIITGGILQIGNGGTTGSLAGNVQNDGTLAFFRSDNITFGGDISGTGGLLFMGNATVTLTGNNTFTGGIAMGGGTLVVSADSELGGAGSTLTLAGSTVQATASFTSNRAIILATGGGTFNTGSNVLTLAGVVSGVGGLVVGEGSSIVLTGTNTYTGGTTISSGALLTLGGAGSIQGDVANSGTMQFAGTGTTFGGVISGSGAVQQVSGTTVLTGNSLHTGGTTISGGTLQLGIADALTMAGVLAINGGTFDLNGYAQTIGALSGTGGSVALNGGALTVNQTGNTTYAGIVSGTGSFIKDGSGTLVLTGANTNTNTIVNGGTLQGTTSSLQGNIANNATVVFDQAATGTYAGNMSGSGGLTKNGNGALILSGDNSGYAGTTTVNAGLLQIGDGVGGTAMAGSIVNNAAVAFMAGGAGLSYGGSISGSGGVTVAGSAQTTLTGTHSYTGGTTVTSTAGLNIGSSTTTAKIVGALIADGGLANFVNADMSGMGAITARNGGTLGFSSSASAAATALLVADAASTLAFSDASTAGTSTITNSGDVRFTGNSSGGTARYIGSGGDLSVAGIAGGSTAIGSIEGNGTVSLGNKQLAVGGNNQSTQYNGVIGGAGGSLLKQGTGTLTLTGNNTYSGGTTVTGGLVNFATLGNFGTGNVTLNGGGVQWATGTSTDISVRLAAFGVNGGTLDTNGNNVTLASGISGPGSLTKAGNGVLTLAGNNTYTGGTFVTGGSIALTGSIAGPVGVSDGLFKANGTIGGTVTVSGSGTLGGSGTVGGIVVDGGTVAPGNSIGTLTVTGNYVQSGGIYQVEVNSAGQSDRINVTGTATLNGGTVQVLADQTGTYARNTSYTILSATGSITGTYSNVTSNLAFLTPTLSYSSTSVTLMLEMLQSAFRNAAQTPNQAAVGAALDAAAPTATGDFANVINALSVLNTQQGPAALTAISGQNYSALSSASVQSAQLFMSNFANQASGATRGGSTAQAAGATSRVQLAEACSVACDTAATGLWGAWGGAIGGFGTIGGNSNSSTVTYNLGGFAGGIDRQVTEELLVGFTLGYSSGTQWTSGFSGRSTSNTYQAGLYGSFLKGPVYVDGLVGYAYSDNQMLRQIQIPGLNSRVATGQTGTNQFFGQIEAGYRIDLGTTANAYLTPWARLQGSTATQNGLTESGADSLNLIVASQTTNSLRSVLGVTLGGEMDIGSGNKLAGQFKVGWAHEFANTDRPVTASFLGAPAVPFTTYGAAPQRDGVILGINATAGIGERTNLFLRYEGEFQGIDNSHALSAGIRFTW